MSPNSATACSYGIPAAIASTTTERPLAGVGLRPSPPGSTPSALSSGVWMDSSADPVLPSGDCLSVSTAVDPSGPETVSR